MIIESLKGLLVKLANDNCTKYIWGTGMNGRILGELFAKNNIDYCGYYSNFENGELEVNGKPIFMNDGHIDGNAMYILSMRNSDDVYKQLIKHVDDANIIQLYGIEIFRELEKNNGYTDYFADEIRRYKNRFVGERCFIIGNGPSLRIEDLNKIKNEYSFGSNYIYKCFDKTDWRPDFYFCSDISGMDSCLGGMDNLHKINAEIENVFLRYSKDFDSYKKCEKDIHAFNAIYSLNEEEFEFSTSCEEHVIIGYTVTYIMIQMAVYMGFSSIYLLGMDHNFSRVRKGDGTFAEQKITDHAKILNIDNVNYYEIDKTTAAYYSANKCAKELGVKIYNATRGGALEVFPRVNFDML